MASDCLIAQGGPGSGNFGHEGRPGERGGSGGGSATVERDTDTFLKGNPELFDAAYKLVQKGIAVSDNPFELNGELKKAGLNGNKLWDTHPYQYRSLDRHVDDLVSRDGTQIAIESGDPEKEGWILSTEPIPVEELIEKDLAPTKIKSFEHALNSAAFEGAQIILENGDVEFISKNTRPGEEPWRITRFSPDGKPLSHTSGQLPFEEYRPSHKPVIIPTKLKFSIEQSGELVIVDEMTWQGGQGSGNFGHSGRVGEVGGSGEGGSLTYPMASRDVWYSAADYKARGGRIIKMSPEEFLSTVRPLEIDEGSRDNIDDLKRHILSGKKLDPLSIYEDGKEDGRHRAVAAKELGIKIVPVIDFRKQSNHHSIER